MSIMDEGSIRKYAGLMRELELTALELRDGAASVRMERSPEAREVRGTARRAAPELSEDSADSALRAPERAASDRPEREGLSEIRSPMVGVFYTSPAENAEPFVKPGDKVSKGDVVGIIEAMKLLNEITSDCDGVIAEALVSNGETVDYGRPLFRVERE